MARKRRGQLTNRMNRGSSGGLFSMVDSIAAGVRGGRMRNMARQEVRDWIVGGTRVDSTGLPIASGNTTTTWSVSAANAPTVGAATVLNWQAVVVAAAVATSTPQVGRMRLDEIKGRITLAPVSGGSAATIACAVAIYISDINTATGLWNVRDPSSPTDVARDDLIYLDAKNGVFPAALNNIEADFGFEIDVPLNILIGGGQCLMVTFVNCSTGGVSLNVGAAFRTKAGPIA